MDKPRIAVIGSCVSRDIFNRSFIPSYKEEFELVSDVYQSSLPSLAREVAVSFEDQESIKQNYLKTISREFDGRNLERVIASKPDFILMDFYSDVHFGVTEYKDHYVTRNHMAFTALGGVDSYYSDQDKKLPARGRFEGFSESIDSYSVLAKNSMAHLITRIRESGLESRIIINSARFALNYTTSIDGAELFSNPNRLSDKNKYWDELDALAVKELGGQGIEYPSELIFGDELHKWGLNPVHYTQAYYDYLWNSLMEITR